MIDIFAPRAGELLADVEQLAFTAGGSAAIIAACAARLGARVSLIAAVGADELGSEWRRRLGVAGVDVDLVEVVPEQLTPISISTIDHDGEKTYAFYRFRGLCDPVAELQLGPAHQKAIRDADVLVITEAALRAPLPRQSVAEVLSLLSSEESPLTLLSVNYRASSWSSAAEAVTTLNAAAAETSIVCCNRDEYQLLDSNALSSRLVFETRGADGVAIHSEGNGDVLPAVPLRNQLVLDTGAGDTFCGAVAVALAEGRRPRDAAEFANAAAAIAISREGTTAAVPSREEIDALLLGSHAQAGGRA